MTERDDKAGSVASAIHKHEITVLLIDDQAMIGEAVRRMLESEKDIVFHFCSDSAKAIPLANEVNPTVILQDLVMPEVDGLTLVKFYRANQATKEVPVIVLSSKEEPKVKAESFALGANDYLVKLPDKIELIARIRHHSQGYINLLERNEAFDALMKSQKKLADELAEAADYVMSMLPKKISDASVDTDWKFVTSTSLGGDTFGYHWLDDEHFVMYLLDVCGHGVGAALLSVSAMDVLRGQTLPNIDFRDPGRVLGGLNEAFDMEEHNDMYFTIWYGVFNKSTRKLAYSSGGHPPALLMKDSGGGELETKELATGGCIIGGMPNMTFNNEEVVLEPGDRLYIYSDGVYEILKPDNAMWTFEEFSEHMRKETTRPDFKIDDFYEFIKKLGDSEILEDDFSMVRFSFK